MKGKVIAINLRKGFIAVEVDSGITVIELLGGYDVEIGDIISGDLESHGGETLKNISQDEIMDVCIQAIYCTPQVAKKLMFD